MNVKRIIDLMGGATSVARILGIKTPSVHGWIVDDSIPRGRLIEFGALLEEKSGGEITRKDLFPNDWQRIWPELAEQEGVANA